MSALPLILGGAALLLLSGKKKKKTTTTNGTTEDTTDMFDDADGADDVDDADDADDTDDTTDDTSGDESEYGKVASGVRQDHIGSHPWRITFDEDGYHAQLTMGAQQSSPVSEEIGIAASLKGAKELLRDHFNQALLDAGRTEADFRDDPVYGKVASGVRQDHIGAHPWRITYKEDGYHAQLTMGAQQSAPVSEEIGITDSLKAAQELLRDHFNQALLDAGRTESDFSEEPVPLVVARLLSL